MFEIRATAATAALRQWQPVCVEVDLQEAGRKAAACAPLTSVVVYEGNLHAGSAKGLHHLKGNELVEGSELHEPVMIKENLHKQLEWCQDASFYTNGRRSQHGLDNRFAFLYKGRSMERA